jgi:hypothetical protein
MPLLPPVIFPNEPPLSGEVRLCLLLAFVAHLATIPFLALAPYGPLSIPLVLFLGVSLLWAVPGLLVFQIGVYALNAVVLLLAAWAFRGARHGEHLLFVAIGIPFLVAVLPMGYARYRLGVLEKIRMRASATSHERRFSSGVWALPVAFLAILAAGWGVLESRKGEEERTVIPVADGRFSRPVTPPEAHRLTDRPDSVWRQIEAMRKETLTRRAAAIRKVAAMRPEERFANDSEAPASFLGLFNLFQGRRYFGNPTYSWESGYEQDRYLPFSCRRDILRKLAPRWTDSTLGPGEISRRVAQGVIGDSLFRTFHCREFPDSSSINFAQVDERSRTASWKSMRPAYGIWITRTVGEIKTIWPRLRIEVQPDSAIVKSLQIKDPVDPEGIRDLFMVSEDPPRREPFPYGRLTFTRELPMLQRDPLESVGSASALLPDSTISFDLTGFDPALVERVWIEARIRMLDMDEHRREVTLAELKCRTRGGQELVLARSERLPKENPSLGVRISEVVVIDINGDGDPDFLVKGNYLPERLIITRNGAIQAEMPLLPPHEK